MANLKNITNLPMAKSSEGLNLIVNDNGAAKQISADAIGKVKTVNGVEPDDNGNINIEIPKGFSGSWNDLEDKPFYEIEAEPIFEGEIKNSNSNIPLNTTINFEEAKEYIVIIDDNEYKASAYLDEYDHIPIVYIEFNDEPVYIYPTYISTNDGVFAEPHNLKIIDPTANEIKKIDPKFIPDSVGLVQRIDVFMDGDALTCDKTYDELQELILKGALLYAILRRSDGTIYLDGGFYIYSHYYYPDDDQLHFYRTDGRSYLSFSSLDGGKKITRVFVN